LLQRGLQIRHPRVEAAKFGGGFVVRHPFPIRTAKHLRLIFRRTLFHGKLSVDQVKGIEGILSAMDAVGDGDQDTLAYALATAYHETGARMVPVREGFAKTDAGARKAVNALAAKRGPKSAVARYARPVGPYGNVYYGRGHVQLTWLENYERSSEDAGTDLVASPDAMLDPVISARVLIRGLIDGRWGGNKGLSRYEGADDHLSDAEAAEARRTVNGKDKALETARYHRRFYDALDLAGWSPMATAAVTSLQDFAVVTRPAPHVNETPKIAHKDTVNVKKSEVSDISPTVKNPSKGGGIALILGGASAVAYAAWETLVAWWQSAMMWVGL